MSKDKPTDAHRRLSATHKKQNILAGYSNSNMEAFEIDVHDLDSIIVSRERSTIQQGTVNKLLDDILADHNYTKSKNIDFLAIQGSGTDNVDIFARQPEGKGLGGEVESRVMECGVSISNNCIVTAESTLNHGDTSQPLKVAERSINRKMGIDAVGLRVIVNWPGYGGWIAGKVTAFDPKTCRHFVEHEDGDNRWIVLSSKRVRLEESCAEDELRLSGTTCHHQVTQKQRNMAKRKKLAYYDAQSSSSELINTTVSRGKEWAAGGGGAPSDNWGSATAAWGDQVQQSRHTQVLQSGMVCAVAPMLHACQNDINILDDQSGKSCNLKTEMELSTALQSNGTNGIDPEVSSGSQYLLRPLKCMKVGGEIVGQKIKVYWPKDKVWYPGIVSKFDSGARKHIIKYDDGQDETLDLSCEKYELIDARLCAGQDAVGLKLRVFWANLDAWIPGKVLEYSTETGEHLIEYHCGEQRWTVLSTKDFDFELSDQVIHSRDSPRVSIECHEQEDQQTTVNHSRDSPKVSIECNEQEDVAAMEVDPMDAARDMEYLCSQESSIMKEEQIGNSAEDGHCSVSGLMDVDSELCMRKECEGSSFAGNQIEEMMAAETKKNAKAPVANKECRGSKARITAYRDNIKGTLSHMIRKTHECRHLLASDLFCRKVLEQRSCTSESTKVQQNIRSICKPTTNSSALKDKVNVFDPAARAELLFPMQCLHPGCNELPPNVFELIKHRAEQHAIRGPHTHEHEKATTVTTVGVSGYRGVTSGAGSKGWRAKYSAGKQYIYLGSFLCARHAALAWDLEARRQGMQNSQLNFPGEIATEAQVKLWRCKKLNSTEPTASYRGVSKEENSPHFAVHIDVESVLHFLGMCRPVQIGLYVNEEDAAHAFDCICRACFIPEMELNFPVLKDKCTSLPTSNISPTPSSAEDIVSTRSCCRKLMVGDAVQARYSTDGQWYCAVVVELLTDGSQLVAIR
jgi:hypothetical protein